MLNNINRIAIIGGPGTGKTTLAKKLSSFLSIPFYSIDDIKFNKNWIPIKEKEVDTKLKSIISKNKWIIEGNHLKNLENILSNTDLVIFLDFHVSAQLHGIFERFFSNFNHCVKDIKNCKEKISFSLFFKTLLFNISKKTKIVALLNKDYKFKLLLFINRKQINTFLDSLTN